MSTRWAPLVLLVAGKPTRPRTTYRNSPIAYLVFPSPVSRLSPPSVIPHDNPPKPPLHQHRVELRDITRYERVEPVLQHPEFLPQLVVHLTLLHRRREVGARDTA